MKTQLKNYNVHKYMNHRYSLLQKYQYLMCLSPSFLGAFLSYIQL